MNKPLLTIISCVIAYLLGSVSVGIIISKVFHGPDLHTVGSGNTGASNVQRTMGWKYGILTFVGDMLKGILSCWIARLLTDDHTAVLLAGLFAIIGHNWPVFFGFKGGKGVSTSTGVLLWCYPIPALICMGVTVLVIALTKYISLGSITLVTLYAVIVSVFYSQGDWFVIAWAVVIAVMCIARHHANIGRLLRGEENKLGRKK